MFLSKLVNYSKLLFAYVKLNFQAEYEYRAAFCSQVGAMFINDCFWLGFWTTFFKRFPVLNDWSSAEVVTLWSVVAAGFGIAHGFFGNAIALPGLIMRGGLDSWMLYPRALLPHLLLGKTHVTSWGDVVFGIVAYLVLVRPDLPHMILFAILLICVSICFVGFSVLSGSLGFFVGNAEALAEQWRFSLISFSTYPPNLFDGPVRLVLYTLIPAAFVGYLPVEALRNLSLSHALLCFVGSITVLAVSVAVFYIGLRRYESGNLTEMRG